MRDCDTLPLPLSHRLCVLGTIAKHVAYCPSPWVRDKNGFWKTTKTFPTTSDRPHQAGKFFRITFFLLARKSRDPDYGRVECTRFASLCCCDHVVFSTVFVGPVYRRSVIFLFALTDDLKTFSLFLTVTEATAVAGTNTRQTFGFAGSYVGCFTKVVAIRRVLKRGIISLERGSGRRVDGEDGREKSKR